MARNETAVLRNGDQIGFGSAVKNETTYIDYREFATQVYSTPNF